MIRLTIDDIRQLTARQDIDRSTPIERAIDDIYDLIHRAEARVGRHFSWFIDGSGAVGEFLDFANSDDVPR